MLENESDEDIVSHLYMSEAYYFNPKCLKRHQVSKTWNFIFLQRFLFFAQKEVYFKLNFEIMIRKR